ncbi:WcaF family extracellular polysaccharide biosynthesis acetyltransferase [Mucilaginibacter auburnensis]|uniref:Putative colanic acid biosynthesis acetyltransferase WcaF n=1 Tax=Mucilaginibacter auburnensis TaxID=1457233 RepID=A0A2H9VMA8_9SPHI|nr:WcaF family extracellular polysaccharide biosynthesis acetyltransferase [Mucilaginibacter auburnensis]PJJ79468.1 putative colanic acid biosynthesis acetyltransferase WcaF [Mucilaginibacter auburnensis]
MQKTDLSAYNNSPYHPGGSTLKRVLWYYVNVLIFKSSWFPFYGLKNALLRLFGSKVGTGVTIKPCVNIKYPWLLSIGNHVWIGENVWVDNLVMITIGNNVCISQGALLLTGSHSYKKTTFNLITGAITLEDGSWIGAQAIVNQGINVGSHAVLTSGSVATKNLASYGIYQGNPAVKVRQRVIE